jgi:hypothetical protein
MKLKNACSPANEAAAGSPGCLDYPMLVLIARLYNQYYAPTAHPIRIYRDPAAQFRAIDEAIASNPKLSCARSDEVCWVSSPFMQSPAARGVSTAAKRKFRPAQPPSWRKNPKEWLSNEDIEAVMRQYEAASRGRMRFVGVFPIDFAKRVEGSSNSGACVSPEVCGLDVAEEIRRGRKHLTFVFNTDPHHKSGQHWISMYVGLDPRSRRSFGVHFYDSVAKPPPQQVKDLMRRLASEIEAALSASLGKGVPINHNKVRRQYQNTECGIFSMLFLLRMMAAERHRTSFQDVCASMGNDKQVHMYRERLFVRPRAPPKKNARAQTTTP